MTKFRSYDFKGQKALIRVDFNVPMNNGQVDDDTRIRAAIPTISHILEAGGACILMSHMGRPKSQEAEFSLRQIIPCLEGLLGRPVQFAKDCVGEAASSKAGELEMGQVLLLENLRYHDEEKKGDKDFASELASLGDVYVNDAFGTAHRAHASTAVVADYMEQKMAGLIIEQEVANIDKVLNDAEKPFTAIVGGAKVSSKISILENLIGRVDKLVIGGGMAYTFFKAMGGKVGGSLVEDDFLDKASELLKTCEAKGTSIHLPADSVVADSFSNDAEKNVCPSDEISDGWMGLDIGPKATEELGLIVAESRTILWNGPMGVFEMENFSKGTIHIAEAVASATDKGAFSLVGGGDSVAAVNKFGLAERVTYISTGGGAMLEYLEGKVLPGIAAVMS